MTLFYKLDFYKEHRTRRPPARYPSKNRLPDQPHPQKADCRANQLEDQRCVYHPHEKQKISVLFLPLAIRSNRGSGGHDNPLLTHFQPKIQFGLLLMIDLTIGRWLIQAEIWLCGIRALSKVFSRLTFWRQETQQFGLWWEVGKMWRTKKKKVLDFL